MFKQVRRTISIVLLVVILVSCLPSNTKAASVRITEYTSKLPVVYIDTDDGLGIIEKTQYKDATMRIQGNEQYPGESANGLLYNGKIKIKGRGNTSWDMPKKPYKIKLDTSTDLFGFGKNKHWVLIANYMDESLMRNTIAYRLAEELGLVSMQTEWVDLVFNGEYVGNYQLCEHIRIGESRVAIKDWEDEAKNIAKAIYTAEEASGFTKDDRDQLEDYMTEHMEWITTGTISWKDQLYTIADYYNLDQNITGGYLLEFSNEYDEESKFMTDSGLRVMINKPEFLNTNTVMMDYIQNYIQKAEEALLAEDGYVDMGEGQALHYSDLIDFDSMVAFWLVNEVLCNNDAVWKSRYAYKDIDSKLYFGPVWDFDWGFGSVQMGTDWYNKWGVSTSGDQNFLKYFVKDPYFCIKAQETYWEIRDYLANLVADGGWMDTQYEYLYESGTANEAIWKYIRGFSGPDGDVAQTKEFLAKRLAWLDTQFATEDGIVYALNHQEEADFEGYERSEELIVSFQNVMEDLISKVASDGRLETGNDLPTCVTVNRADVTALEVYVNGIHYGTFPVTNGNATFIINQTAFTEELESKNVITFIGKNNEEILCKNFASIVVGTALGDIDGDRVITLKDARYMLRAVLHIVDLTEEQQKLADIDKNGIVELLDVQNVLKMALRIPN